MRKGGREGGREGGDDETGGNKKRRIRLREGGKEGGREGGGITYHLIRLSIRALIPKTQEEDTIPLGSACFLEGAADVVEDLCFHVSDCFLDELL